MINDALLIARGLTSVAVGDFSGDGRPDLACEHARKTRAGTGTWPTNVSVLVGNGDRSFQLARGNFGVGSGPRSVAVGDFNGNGLADLAVANADSNNVSVLINNTRR